MFTLKLNLLLFALLLAFATAHDRDDPFHRPGRHYAHSGGKHERQWQWHWKHHPKSRLPKAKLDLEVFENETIQINVRKIDVDANGIDILKVSLRVHVIDANIHVNGHKVNHEVITAMHLQTELDEVSKYNKVIRHRPCVVHIRVMVQEIITSEGIKQFAVQEEILEVDNEKVTQIEVKEVLLNIGNGMTEVKRKITLFETIKSKIHNKDRKNDFYPEEGHIPKKPYNMGKDDMDRMIPKDHRKPPHHSDLPEDDEDTKDDKPQDGKGYGKQDILRFCKWFHRLPLGARIISFITLALIGISLITCCARCFCKKTTKKSHAVKYEVADNVSEVSFDMEAPPLSGKKPIDEMKLIA